MNNKSNLPDEELDQVWYACYGSNLLQERFEYYIGGGRPAGSQRIYEGCTNRTPPQESKPFQIKAELYFARRSKTWSGGGAAFIEPDEDSLTLGKIYRITRGQFNELVKQEIRFKGDLKPDLAIAIKDGHLITQPETWYGKILYLGEEDGLPVFSFTNVNYLETEINEPNVHYLRMIILGLKETYRLSKNEILEYLFSKKGIEGKIELEDLKNLIDREF